MEGFKVGSVFEMGDNKDLFTVMAMTKIDGFEEDFLVAVPISDRSETPIVYNDRPVVFRVLEFSKVEIVGDIEVIKKVLEEV